MSLHTIFACITVWITCPQAVSAVISNGVSLSGANGQVTIYAWRQSYGGFLSATFTGPNASFPATLTPTTGTCGIAHEWVAMNPGDVVGLSAFTNVSWIYDQCGRANFANAQVPTVSSGSALTVGFRLGYGDDWNYGWVQLVSRAGDLEIVGSAQEDTGLGIIAGSVTVVPEPSVWGVVFSLGLTRLFRRRRPR
jgi:hypothetical protein